MIRGKWLIRVEPEPEELLSSWLSRSSFAHRLSAYRFCNIVVPGTEIWARDIDSSISTKTIEVLSKQAGIEEHRLVSMTFRSERTRCAPHLRRRVPFLRPLSVRHRSRRNYGLQYCPRCLAETKAFIRRWRWGFVTSCHLHRCELLDRCSKCAAAIVVHRGFSNDILRCHQCGHLLTNSRAPAWREGLCDVQRNLRDAMGGGGIAFGKQRVSAEDYVQGVHVLITVMITTSALYSAVGARGHSIGLTKPIRSFLLCTPQQRRLIFEVVGRVLDDWKTRSGSYASDIGLTQRSFISATIPEFMLESIKALPAGVSRGRLPAPLKIYGREMRRLRRLAPSEYVRRRSQVLVGS